MLREEVKQVELIAQTAADAVAKFLVQEMVGLKTKIEKLELELAKLKTLKIEKPKEK